jgi:hypothetical protein
MNGGKIQNTSLGSIETGNEGPNFFNVDESTLVLNQVLITGNILESSIDHSPSFILAKGSSIALI